MVTAARQIIIAGSTFGAIVKSHVGPGAAADVADNDDDDVAVRCCLHARYPYENVGSKSASSMMPDEKRRP